MLKAFPKKRHIEYISALLSIPVLLSVVALNLLSISNNKNKSVSVPSSAPVQAAPIIIERSSTSSAAPTAPATAQSGCIKKVSPISIDYPSENQTLSDNPLCFVIDYTDSDYCSVAWSYKINNGSWSDYSTNAPCIYNPPEGNNTFHLRVQSIVDQSQQKALTRNFTYVSSVTIIPTPTATASPTPLDASSTN